MHYRTYCRQIAVIAVAASAAFISCNLFGNDDDTGDAGSTTVDFTVKFENAPSSAYTITAIQLQAMGTNASPSPSGVWSDNVLAANDSIPPGGFSLMTLDIPAGEYSEFRVGVRDSSGTELMLHEQAGYPASGIQGTIEHWGGDERTVTATIGINQSNGLIMVTGYGEWTGIE